MRFLRMLRLSDAILDTLVLSRVFILLFNQNALNSVLRLISDYPKNRTSTSPPPEFFPTAIYRLKSVVGFNL